MQTDEWGFPMTDELNRRADELDGHADWLRDYAIRKSFHIEHPDEKPNALEQIRTAVELASFLRREAAHVRLTGDIRTPASDNRTRPGDRHLKAVP